MIQVAAITSVGNVGISLRIVSSAELPLQDLLRKARVVLDELEDVAMAESLHLHARVGQSGS